MTVSLKTKPDTSVQIESGYTLDQLDQLIAVRRTTKLLPYEPLESSPSYRLPRFKAIVHGIIRKGYPINPNYLFPLDAALPWHHENRTVAYQLQSFEPVTALLMAHSHDGDQTAFNKAVGFLDDWLFNARAPNTDELNGQWREQNKDFFWYDMAVGLRSYRLAYMTDVLLREKIPDTGKITRLLNVLDWHRTILMQEDAFSGHNNHGLYQALGQIAMSRRFLDLPDFNTCYQQAQSRLDIMLTQQFFDDGTHREHSPGYHWMILGTLHEAARAGLITQEKHLKLIDRIEEAMSWFIQPNLVLPAFGDTDAGGVASGYYTAQDFRNPALRYTLSQGTDGIPPTQEMRIFQDAGYAVLRSPNPKTGKIETYMAQAAGFHSRTHKHADHLTFVWHDKGRDILVDAGRYGYKGKTDRDSDLWRHGFWYADPQRVYVEKTRAHNTVEIDGQDFPRRNVKPFGSAIRRVAKTKNHVHAVETECRYFQTIRHNRLIFTCPRRFLIVVDWLKDNAEQPHDYRQWFHLAPGLDLKGEGDRLTITRQNKPFASILSLMPDIGVEKMVRAQSDPEMQGWVSHEKGGVLLPNWAFSMTAAHRSQTAIATLFSLYPDAMPWMPAQIAASGQSGRLFWQDRSGFSTVAFDRRPGEDFTISYKRAPIA